MDPQDQFSPQIWQELKELKDLASSLKERIAKLEQKIPPAEVPISVRQPAPEKILPVKTETPAEASSDASIESKIGRIWFNRIGIVAIVFGFAYFLKYAFDNNWIGETGRIIISLCAGLAMILCGEIRNKENLRKFNEGLIAGGAAIMYLAIFAAFNFYHLIGPAAAFVFMSCVIFYTGVYSVRFDSPGVLTLGMAGGFLTPLLLGSSRANPAFFMLYVLFLDIGVLAVSYFKKYAKTNYTALIFTIISYYSWFFARYRHQDFTLALGFLTGVFTLFVFLSVLYNFIHKQSAVKADVVTVILNGIFYFLGLWQLLSRELVSYRAIGLVSLGLAVVYLIFSYSALLRTSGRDRTLVLSYLSMTLLFATLVIPIELKGYLITLGFLIEATVLVWLGFKIDYKELRTAAMIVAALAIFRILFFDFSSWAEFPFIFNPRFLTYLVLSACCLTGAYLYRENAGQTGYHEKSMATFLAIAAALVLLGNLTIEINAYFNGLSMARYKTIRAPYELSNPAAGLVSLYALEQFSISALWGAYSLAMILLGIFRKFRALRIMAILIFAVTIIKVFAMDMWYIGQLWRILSFIALGLGLVATSFFYQKYKDEFLGLVKE